MSTATIGTDGWDSVVTTTANTVFQNRSKHPVYITTEATGSLAYDEAYELNPGEAIVIASGYSVSAVTFNADTTLFYMTV